MKRKKVRLDREQALGAIPVQGSVVRREERGEKLYVTLLFARPGWQRLLGGDNQCQRTFGLDSYGREVYEACDGERTVEGIVQRFATQHHISVVEAEMAVTTFMQTLMKKGLIAMTLEKERIKQ